MMDSCSVKHYILAIDTDNYDDATYRAQIDDGEKKLRHNHHFMHAGASLASGGLDAKDAIAIGRLRQPNSVL